MTVEGFSYILGECVTKAKVAKRSVHDFAARSSVRSSTPKWTSRPCRPSSVTPPPPPRPVRPDQRAAVDKLAMPEMKQIRPPAAQVNEGSDGLERRVDETVVAAAHFTIAAASANASAHLKAAWSATYGFHPDPEKAYSQAVKAAEAVVIPATIPNAGTPTLGTALKHLDDTAAKWTTVLDDKTGNPASAEPLIGLIRMLWQGQRDRHAGGPTSKPTTQEAAEAAVHAAILIVQWFNSQAVVKNP
ncbi:hypothetical protein [Streptosporangium sp. V21-05]|uniref:hypothetical protein n=1 Tax=Streptosporangium sp. V21-05 TaxID=3446115 RepID=UPI003F52E844